jgi:mono/diheme cytochrome c family protein
MEAMLKDRLLHPVSVILLALIGATLTSGSLGAQTTATAPSQGDVTFTKEVAPILQQRCQECHRPNAIAPMSLLTYEEARPWAKAIKEKVATRIMPPWYVDPHVGINKFKNYGGLSEKEIATIVKWVDEGAPKGNPADMPPPVKFDDDKWKIGTPELVVAMPQDLLVGGKGPDMWKNIVVDPGLNEDRYIKAVEVKPTKGRRVIHHIGTSLIYPDGGSATIQAKNANIFEEGSGRLMKAGTKVIFGLHIHPYQEDTPTNVEIGFIFYPKGYVPKYVAVTELMGDDHELDLPPNTDNIRTDSYLILSKPTRLLSFAPHMHTRGKAMCLEAIYPERSEQRDGSKVETINCVNNFDFNWMMVYEYASDVQPLFPAGTVLHFIGWHNNTASNRLNNDPDNWIGYGQRSIDDMSMAWITYFNLSPEDFQQAVAERKGKSKETNDDLSSKVTP